MTDYPENFGTNCRIAYCELDHGMVIVCVLYRNKYYAATISCDHRNEGKLPW